MNVKIFTLLICLTIVSCGSTRTFHDYARSGDTVAVPVGMQPTFNKDNITITITPQTGAPIVLTAADPSIRAVINFYPDPISNMVVSREINEDTSPSSETYSGTTLFITNQDKDYYQTTVFIDIPDGLAVGLAQINISDITGASHNSELDIISSTGGTPNPFKANIPDSEAEFDLTDVMLNTLARAPHTEVTFDSSSIPKAIEINFTHDPDKTVGGIGQAYVVNPLGYIKNLSWSDDGNNLKIILIESSNNSINNMKDYKFYIAGTVQNLQLTSISSYDGNGNTSIDVVTPTITTRN